MRSDICADHNFNRNIVMSYLVTLDERFIEIDYLRNLVVELCAFAGSATHTIKEKHEMRLYLSCIRKDKSK
jgi:hypothetical protein